MSDQLPIRILIVDDQQSLCQLCASIGGGMGFVCYQAESAEAALERVKNDTPELMLVDLSIGKMAGLKLLAEVKKRSPRTEVALVSDYGNPESAVEAMRQGAYDFIVKPLGEEKVRLILERMVEKVRLVRENEYLRNRLQSKTHPAPAPPQLCTDLEELERLTVQRVYEQVDGDKEQAQKLLGISRATLYRKIKRYGIQTRQARQRASGQEVRDAAERVIVLSQS
jgi:DNA-binding NtrC family response regulator